LSREIERLANALSFEHQPFAIDSISVAEADEPCAASSRGYLALCVLLDRDARSPVVEYRCAASTVVLDRSLNLASSRKASVDWMRPDVMNTVADLLMETPGGMLTANILHLLNASENSTCIGREFLQSSAAFAAVAAWPHGAFATPNSLRPDALRKFEVKLGRNRQSIRESAAWLPLPQWPSQAGHSRSNTNGRPMRNRLCSSAMLKYWRADAAC